MGKVAEEMGHLVVSRDRDMEATIKTDIMNWGCKSVEPGAFNFIWASPPSTVQQSKNNRGKKDR